MHTKHHKPKPEQALAQPKSNIFRVTVLTAFLAVISLFPVYAQSLPLATPIVEEYLRRQQIQGNFPMDRSFMLRPMLLNSLPVAETTNLEEQIAAMFTFNELENVFSVTKLPVQAHYQLNSNYPFGQNNGAMIPNRGSQLLVTGGVIARYGKISLQIQPEVHFAQNKEFRGMPSTVSTNWRDYYEFLNRIDRPERFGEESHTHLLLGNSSLRYTFQNGLSLGVSNEYLWWGPGYRNSIMMSNNAPGFLHVTVNTAKPIATKWGSFEGQLIAGSLQNSGYLPPNSTMEVARTPLYYPKRDEDSRYLAGMVVSFQPKVIPGLYLGYSSTSQVYTNELDGLGDYLPIFNGRKRFAGMDDPVIAKRQQQSAGFFRWLSTKGSFEIYGEYGTNGNSKTMREVVVNPDLYRAFTVGFNKLIRLKKADEFIQLNFEQTQTGQTVRKAIRESKTWYTHDHVRHGYTHRGQTLGYGHGSGSNSLFLEVSWVREMDKIGLQFERIVNNNDAFYLHFEHINGWDRYWVDLVPSFVLDRKVGNLLISSRFQYVNTLNYYWVLERDPDATLYRLQKGDDRKNIVAHVRIAYLF
ncbi:capsule assembly Wzi family protein [Lunatimonas salinarum]|uniref:capsule assembly Wzi family protein n=1 Tax=Lunatimonas salinarum TaxID=1774590 RepID=UPI001FD84F36|nr:capsule assembly Wzi family protein [Lunatimonas salinarum]